jgi:hypothetical protein
VNNSKPIPPKPTDTSDAGWERWAAQHFPYELQWYTWTQTRSDSEITQFGTPESLDDLRGIGDPKLAGLCARHWWNTFENTDRILREHAAQKIADQQKERKRLILLAKQALDGKLGESPSARDDARSTAQTLLRQAPEHCSNDDLDDWIKMHQYAKRLASGWRGDRPKLAVDLRREAAQKREMNDIDSAIDARPAQKPYEQREMYR